MSSMWPTLPRLPVSRRRLGLIGGASKLLGTTVVSTVPLQRHNPSLVLAACLVELAALAALVATGSLGAMLALVVASIALVVVMVTNTRKVVALTGKGNVLLSASLRGWPNGVVGPAPRKLDLPPPAGLGVRVEIAGETWWVDRSAFRLLRRARDIAAADVEEQ